MNLDALPYTSFIVLLEFAVGSLWVCLFADWRGRVAVTFVQFSAAMVTVTAAVMLLNSFVLDPKSAIGGYRLDDDLLTPVKVAVVVFLLTTLPYNWFLLKEKRRPAMITGSVSAVAGVALVTVTAYYVSLPTWGFAGALLSIAAGTLAVGLVVLAMTLGHWYLVTPRLPREPLAELTLLLVAAVVLQAVLLIINVVIPAREVPEATAFLGSSTLGANPAFWLRITIGLMFPAALGYMSYISSRGYPANENAMMSATGLLYIAVGAVLVGEVLARGLLFLTGVPV
jgi:drug/metabolite transporter (DMT)-like permease